jgi:hypothetical protein
MPIAPHRQPQRRHTIDQDRLFFQVTVPEELIRASTVIIYFFFGYQKWFDCCERSFP